MNEKGIRPGGFLQPDWIEILPFPYLKRGDRLMQKESIELHVMWHIDALIHSFPITIVTTIDGQGGINAAPYSLVIPFCSSPKNTQMLLIANKNWHMVKTLKKSVNLY